jgi:hypothetical protein
MEGALCLFIEELACDVLAVEVPPRLENAGCCFYDVDEIIIIFYML